MVHKVIHDRNGYWRVGPKIEAITHSSGIDLKVAHDQILNRWIKSI